jgi:hypothetical protein
MSNLRIFPAALEKPENFDAPAVTAGAEVGE